MTTATSEGRRVHVEVSNIGGIDEASVSFSPGVTVLVGRNATNRTSFLRALMAGLGSDQVALKADADEGGVVLSIGGETYERNLERRGDAVVTNGEPYLDDPTMADLFAFLDETNEARRAVANGDDLREVIMRPVDVDEIEAEIDRLKTSRSEVEAELEEVEAAKDELPRLEERREELRESVDEKRDQLSEITAEIKSITDDIEASREWYSEFESKLEALTEMRAELEEVEFQLETQREMVTSLEDDRDELAARLEDFPPPSDSELSRIDDRLVDLRERHRTIESEISRLRNLIQFNEGVVGSGSLELGRHFDVDVDAGGAGSVTDELVATDETVCWTCGSVVEDTRIERTIEELRGIVRERQSELESVNDRIESVEAERAELEDTARRRDDLEGQLATVESKLEDRREAVAELEDKRASLRSAIQEEESAIDESALEEHESILTLNKEQNDVRFEYERLSSQLDDVVESIRTHESRIEEEPSLRERLDEIEDELDKHRSRVDRLERDAVERFNEHMAEVLSLLSYDNVERIWIERLDAGEGATSTFEVHVVRSDDTGTVYEDTVSHLSESEREVAGLVFALAGYLVHDLHEDVPFVLLDSLEAIDAERIAALVEYFREHVPYVVVALLPEDAAALESDDPVEYVEAL